MDPHFSGTQKLLGTRLGRLGAFNVPFFVEMGTFYNSTYFFAGLILLVVAGLVLGLSGRGAMRRRTLVLLLWFAPALILHLFVMDLPGTHFYLFMGCWSLVAALPLAAVTESGALRPLVRGGILAAVALWLLISAGYLYLLCIGAPFIAMGLWASVLSRSQIVAAILTFALLFLLFIVPVFMESQARSGWLRAALGYINLWNPAGDFGKGIVDSRLIVYCLTSTLFLLLLCSRSLQVRKAA